ncbi:MAG: PD-(D/E)XK nuclease family protein [Clostridia bacterium]|nr:PD-(D/E)XK nuclease family protein [Clostridia bacterium]
MLTVLGGNQEALRRELLRMAAPGGRMIVIVPEQYTLQTERELMDGLNLPGFFDLEVLSPSRLTERVFALTGSGGQVRIDARGKQLTLARVLLKCKNDLKYYESAIDRQGFIERMGTLIATLKQAQVTPEALRAHAEAMKEGASKDKLMDLSLLYAEYENRLSGQFVDGEDVLDDMLRRLPESGIAQNTRAAVYGFDVLTGQMNRLLLALARQSEDVQVLLVMGQDEAFAPVRDSAGRLQKEAEETGVSCRLEMLPFDYTGQTPSLAHLSKEYPRNPPKAWAGIPSGLRLYAAPNPYFEAHFAAQEMVLLHEQGVDFGDMAVAMGDPGFSGVLSAVLRSYRVPAYVARKLPIVTHGAVRFLLSSLRAVAEGYSAPEMISVIKSGYAPITEEDAWNLENYILSHGIRGKLWLAPFARGSAQECAQVEDARQALIEPLQTLRQAFKDAENAGQVLSAVYDYLTVAGLYEKLTAKVDALLSHDMAAEAMQNQQVWEAVTQLLSQAHALLSDSRVSPRQLSSWLEAGLEACELSSLPPTAGAVACGQVGNLPLARPKALFLMNLTDGLLSPPGPGLLSPQEQEEAEKSLHAYLSLDADGQDALAWLDVWKALSSPRKYLYLSRAQATQDGGALRPFAGLSQIRAIFPGLVEEGGVTQRAAVQFPLVPRPALDALGMKMREGPLEGEWKQAWRYLSQAEETKAEANALLSAFQPETGAPPLPPEVTHELFMERVMSVSRLENFAVCPYKHFVEQGLAPKPRKEWTLTPIDAGNFYHSALEGFTRLLPTIPHWPKIDRKTCDAVVDQAAEPLFEQLLSGVMGDSARMRAQGEKYRRVLKRVAWTFTRGAKQSAFTPQSAEVKFGYPGGIPPVELTLKDGSKVYVRGIIDRIDRYAGDEGVYLRVVDYKSGAEKIDAARIYWGAQLQLLLYLRAALSQEEGAQPAGAFYMRVADPLLPDQEDTAQVEDALARALCLRGVALKDAAILRAMDDGTPPLTLPKVLTADGGFDQRAVLATLEDLTGLIRYAGEMAAQWAEKMRAGEIDAAPLCDQKLKGPCEYCDYAAICRRDVSRAPENARLMQEMRFDALLEKINKPKD